MVSTLGMYTMDGNHRLFTAIVPATTTITMMRDGMDNMMEDIICHALDNADHIIIRTFEIYRRVARVFLCKEK